MKSFPWLIKLLTWMLKRNRLSYVLIVIIITLMAVRPRCWTCKNDNKSALLAPFSFFLSTQKILFDLLNGNLLQWGKVFISREVAFAQSKLSKMHSARWSNARSRYKIILFSGDYYQSDKQTSRNAIPLPFLSSSKLFTIFPQHLFTQFKVLFRILVFLKISFQIPFSSIFWTLLSTLT